MKQIVAKFIPNISKNTQNGKTHMQWLVAILLNIPVLNYGLQIGWPACVAKVLQSEESPIGTPLSIIDISWLTSSPNLSAMLSIPVWTIFVDKFGRKPCIIICTVLLCISWLTILLAASMTTLMAGRIVGGIAGSGCSYIMPMYIKELSQDDLRGSLGMMRNVARILGILAIYIMGGYLTYNIILWIALAVSLISVLGVLSAPEFPSYFVKIGKLDIAASTIASLRSLNTENTVVQNGIASLKAEDEKFKSIPNITFIGMFKQKSWRKGFVFMFLLMICHGLNGGFAIIAYAPTILDIFKVTVNPELQSLSVPIFMLLGCLLSIVLIERIGRKPILVVSFLVSLVSFIALAAILMLHERGVEAPGWLAVSVLVLPVCAYAAAVSPMPFIIMAEMFNFRIRAKVMGCLGMVGWAGVFIHPLIFGPMSNEFGPHVTFIFYAVINLFGSLVVLVLLPETKRKSIEEIELELEKKLEW